MEWFILSAALAMFGVVIIGCFSGQHGNSKDGLGTTPPRDWAIPPQEG